MYTIDYANESSSNLSQLFDSMRDKMADNVESYSTQGLTRAVLVNLQGTLQLSVIENKESGILVEYRLTNASTSIRIDSQNARQEESEVEKTLGKGILIRMSPSGAVSKIWLPHGIKPTPSGIIRTVVSHTQVVFPDKAPEGTAWETIEDDQSGRYQVAYTILPQETRAAPNRLDLLKSKLRQIAERPRPSSSRQTITTQYVPSGAVRISMDKRTGTIQRITGSERSIIRMDEKDVGQSATSFSMVLKRQAKLTGNQLTILRSKAKEPEKTGSITSLWKDASHSEGDRMLYRQKLGNDTIDSLLPKLAAAEKTSIAAAEQTELFLKFRALIYLQPATCRQISEIAARSKPESHTARILISALASTATPEAQAGFSVILRHNSSNTDYLVQLLPLIGMFEEPTIASEQLLKDFAFFQGNREIASTAVLALGNMAGHLSIRDPGRADRIISDVLSKYGTSEDESDIGLTLEVLGNAALEGRLTDVLLHTKDPRPTIRKDAVSALRFYTHPKAGETILAMLSQDVDVPVRQAAASAMGFQNINGSEMSSMIAAFKKEADEIVRGEILKVLWKSRQRFAEIEALVKGAQTGDPSEQIRKMSSEYMKVMKVQ